MDVVGKIPLVNIIFLFVVYVVAHLIIVYQQKKMQEVIESNKYSKDDITKYKILKFLGKWFPALYVVFLLGLFYL